MLVKVINSNVKKFARLVPWSNLLRSPLGFIGFDPLINRVHISVNFFSRCLFLKWIVCVRNHHYCWLTCITDDTHIFIVVTVVGAQGFRGTLEESLLRANTVNIIQENLTRPTPEKRPRLRNRPRSIKRSSSMNVTKPKYWINVLGCFTAYEHLRQVMFIDSTIFLCIRLPSKASHCTHDTSCFGIKHVITHSAPCSVHLNFYTALVRIAVGIHQANWYTGS